MAFVALLALFFVSGACGLSYQVLWMRLMSRVFGTTTFAVSVLLASFMAGLGLGSYLAGRLLSRRRDLLRLFAVAELGVGIYAAVLPGFLPLLERLLLETVGFFGVGSVAESGLKLLLGLAVLLTPTTLMGLTLPLLAQHAVLTVGQVGFRVGTLYAVNTLGATAGCFVSGFFLVPELGVTGTTRLAVTGNFIVAALALALSIRAPERTAGGASTETDPGPAQGRLYPEGCFKWVAIAFAASGFAGLALEVVWTRLLTLVFESNTYSFTTMLTTFLTGIGSGSLVAAWLTDRARDPLKLLGVVEIGIGLSSLGIASLFVRSPDWVRVSGLLLGGTWEDFALAKFLVAFALLLVPTFLFGASFPLAAKVATRSVSGLGETVGYLYSANTVGGIFGSFLAGWVLLPALGTDGTLRLLSSGLVLVGLVLVLLNPLVSRGFRFAVAAACVGAFVVAAGRVSDPSRRLHERTLRSAEAVVFYREGPTATVMVAAHAADSIESQARRLTINLYTASDSSPVAARKARVQGVIPFLFEKAPQSIVNLTMGSGISCGTLGRFTAEDVDCIDISPEVIEAVRYFNKANYDLTANRRVRVHLDDGRHFLLKRRSRYDSITMEPMPPGLSGMAYFYTADFYALSRTRLTPGGIIAQWVPLYLLGVDDVKLLYRTFARSWPYTMLFNIDFDTYMVGSDRPLRLLAEGLSKRAESPVVQSRLREARLLEARELLAMFLLSRDAMLEYAGPGPLMSDDIPYVEFSGPRAKASETSLNLLQVTRFAEPVTRYLELSGSEGEALRAVLDADFALKVEAWRMARARRGLVD